jgi:hypothetical protein
VWIRSNPGSGRQASPEQRGKNSPDGRDRSGATEVDEYETTQEGKVKEQKEMNARGGLDELDNKRNEIAPEDWDKHGIDPPKKK